MKNTSKRIIESADSNLFCKYWTPAQLALAIIGNTSNNLFVRIAVKLIIKIGDEVSDAICNK